MSEDRTVLVQVKANSSWLDQATNMVHRGDSLEYTQRIDPETNLISWDTDSPILRKRGSGSFVVFESVYRKHRNVLVEV